MRVALELFAREEAPRGITWEQLVAAFPNDDVVPVVLDIDAAAHGDLVGRCNECSSAVYAGNATIAIGWPVKKPVWKTFTPSLARTSNTTPRRRERQRRTRSCTPCSQANCRCCAPRAP